MRLATLLDRLTELQPGAEKYGNAVIPKETLTAAINAVKALGQIADPV